MAEPSITVVAGPAVVGITTAALLPGVDLNAVIGAWAGALFFVTWAKNLSAWARLGYLIVSWIGGYFAAVELVGQAVTKYTGLPALLAAAVIVTALISVVEWFSGGGMPGWIKAFLGWVRRAMPGAGGSNG